MAAKEALGACSICGFDDWTEVYAGPVREGKFGTSVPGVILQCGECGVQRLHTSEAKPPDFYTSGAYRREVDNGETVQDYFDRHDAEQLPRFSLLERVPLRGRVAADIGCGGGSFLDGLAGLCSETIAIEPMIGYHASLAKRGHVPYESSECALREWRGRVDLAVCFSVVEHVPDPVGLLRDAYELLAPGGTLLLSTPNLRDVLLAAGGDPYWAFFYRGVHLHYFDARSLSQAASAAGFSSFAPFYRHRFGFANFVGWLREGRPTQNEGHSPLGERFDRIWRAELEESGVADYLYAYCTK